jgi:hypothetical protein
VGERLVHVGFGHGVTAVNNGMAPGVDSKLFGGSVRETF